MSSNNVRRKGKHERAGSKRITESEIKYFATTINYGLWESMGAFAFMCKSRAVHNTSSVELYQWKIIKHHFQEK